ncbi:uncharacterized protein BDZ99DRAFT_468731 [Mytilinidion resinicola]|uniref:Apple domain-containing protein n=1 Tax=Mytilinidion resinicola TaxID=574789 RepID=A0A6A6Y3H3_9PEZI|nr:uncharacterized protein BDZ99DRAFT_468731 [Mytilinidion resinicola]KAF2802775.1 hypothetical protein BDZ99DRAFT_468731 [Mytilinidion resinicola]
MQQIPGTPSFHNGAIVQLGMWGSVGSASACCNACFLNSNCVYYSTDATANTCWVYFTSPSSPQESCTTTSCSRGVHDWDPTTSTDGKTYYQGNCMA